jgi:GxxExxY protein
MEDRVERAANRVIGAVIEVHRMLGPGYLESIYEQALAVEMTLRNIPFAQQLIFALDYKGHSVGEGRLDFLVDECLIVELKAVDALAPIHTTQVVSYLKGLKLNLGLLLNFNVPVLKDGVKRVIR